MEKIKKLGNVILNNLDFVLAVIFIIIVLLNSIAGNYGREYFVAWIGFWSCIILNEVRYIGRKIDNHFKFNLPNLTNFNNLIEEYGEVDVKFTK